MCQTLLLVDLGITWFFILDLKASHTILAQCCSIKMEGIHSYAIVSIWLIRQRYIIYYYICERDALSSFSSES